MFLFLDKSLGDDLFSDIPEQIRKYSLNSTKKGGCIPEAYRLKASNGFIGDVYFVSEYNGCRLGHAYYVEDSSCLGAFALNQADNGYEGFPALKVWEVLEFGFTNSVWERKFLAMGWLNKFLEM